MSARRLVAIPCASEDEARALGRRIDRALRRRIEVLRAPEQTYAIVERLGSEWCIVMRLRHARLAWRAVTGADVAMASACRCDLSTMSKLEPVAVDKTVPPEGDEAVRPEDTVGLEAIGK